MKTIPDLLDNDLISASVAAQTSASEREVSAKTDLAAKRLAVSQAQATLDAAVRGTATGKAATIAPADAQRALAGAKDELDLAQQLHGATAQGLREAAQAVEAARVAAYKPVMAHGAAERVAAASDFQAGLTALRMAVARSEAATVLVRAAIDSGLKIPFDGSDLAPVVHNDIHRQPAEYRRSLRDPDTEGAKWGFLQ